MKKKKKKNTAIVPFAMSIPSESSECRRLKMGEISRSYNIAGTYDAKNQECVY